MTINCSGEINQTIPSDFTIDYSADGITWVTAVTVNGTSFTGVPEYKIWQFDENYNILV